MADFPEEVRGHASDLNNWCNLSVATIFNKDSLDCQSPAETKKHDGQPVVKKSPLLCTNNEQKATCKILSWILWRLMYHGKVIQKYFFSNFSIFLKCLYTFPLKTLVIGTLTYLTFHRWFCSYNKIGTSTSFSHRPGHHQLPHLTSL